MGFLKGMRGSDGLLEVSQGVNFTGQVHGVGGGLPYAFNHMDSTIYYVRAGDESYYGNWTAGNDDENSGKTWNGAFATVQKAFDTVKDGDIVYIHGEIHESAYTPYKGIGSDHVSVIGASTPVPRYGTDNTKWQYASGGTYCADVRAQGWHFQNICFNLPSAAGSAGIILNKSGSGTTEKKADETSIYGCLFANGGTGIQLNGAPNECRIIGNTFRRQRVGGDDTAIYVYSTSSQVPRRYIVANNWFQDNDNHIHVDAHGWFVTGNHFGKGYQATLVEVCALSGRMSDQGDYNTVQGNYFPHIIAEIAPAYGYQDGSNSEWSGNWCIDGLYNAAIPA